jgi:hypothetical protein
MKQKDVIYAVLAGIIFCAAGYIPNLCKKVQRALTGNKLIKLG